MTSVANPTSSGNSVLSVCIPCYGKPVAIVTQAVTSAARWLPDNSELLVLPDGPRAGSELHRAQIPSKARVINSEKRLGLVGNWNRCLKLARGDVIHILHDDDVVTSDFYAAILDLRRRFPKAALYGTGTAPVEAEESRRESEPLREPFLLEGDDAAAFILDYGRYSAGSVALARSVVTAKGPFRDDFPYCPDEEAFLRYAAQGGLAFDPAPLYRVRTHEQQARYSTWRRPDFVAGYIESRVDGAGHFSPAVIEFALHSSTRRVISIAVSLALGGEGDIALRQLDELGVLVPACRRWPRFWLARAAGRSRLWRKAAALRRRYVVSAGTSRGRELDARSTQ